MPNPSLCISCQKAKSHKLPFPTSDSRSNKILGLIHCDLWGPAPITSISGYRYYIIFIDDHSRFTWFYPLKHKTNFYQTFLNFQSLFENQFSTKIKIFKSDGGGEFISKNLQSHFTKCGIITDSPVPIHHLRMVEQRENTGISPKQVSQCCFIPLFLFTSGLKPSVLQSSPLTACQHQS